MAHALTFDTLAYAKKLIAAGVSEKQAEVQAETFAEIIDEQITTRQDLKEVEVALKRDMKELELALKLDIQKIKSDIIKWVAAMLVAQAAIVAALVKLL